MEQGGLALFTTAIGDCGIAWSGRGVIGLQLPEATPAATLARLRRRFQKVLERDPPEIIREVIRSVTFLLDGAKIDFMAAPLDYRQTDPWDRSVYEVARTIQPGDTLSYGEIATRLGDRRRAREVGEALARNPWPIIVPCHRVVAAAGKTGGFSAPGGVKTKLRLLEIESRHASQALPLFTNVTEKYRARSGR
jgi:methylated-DNA-[protein]-cysteine S-methyltransferase